MRNSGQPSRDNPASASGDQEERLEFPVDPGFDSKIPHLDPQIMLRRIAENLRERSTRPGELERLSTKIDVEFSL